VYRQCMTMRQLEASGDYGILRWLRPRDVYAPAPAGEPVFTRVILDTETKGLDTAACEVIELGMVRFTYGADGTVYEVSGRFFQLQEPSAPLAPEIIAPLAPEIIRLTGLNDVDLAGKAIDPVSVEALIAGANLIIAHNAGFDRQLPSGAGRLSPT
jgi:DNA polymerase-3 subunit epsilon